MDNERIKGAGNQAKGAIKQGIGELTGDAKLEAEGRMDKAKGKVQSAVGETKDAARDAVDGKDRV
ncbi:CsbD family protein [Roseomonas frigidaquae]|uniref:CsbD family protein n=1 Tax=Falsiroseomonas frigidaquae TaxID=487318 RepID=A0ABX1EXB9_9PROT|nr:CsbD family protein [Falsiroseomonas frigidaquae]NKE44725.1 CsbD family protein [Falsiroseomonas frigidaquae]